MDEIEFLELFGSSAMCWKERIEESLMVGAPPLCKTIADVPF